MERGGCVTLLLRVMPPFWPLSECVYVQKGISERASVPVVLEGGGGEEEEEAAETGRVVEELHEGRANNGANTAFGE